MTMISAAMDIIDEEFIEFKTQRIEEEWKSGNLSKRLVMIVKIAAFIHMTMYGKKLMITSLFRSLEENVELYKKLGRKHKVSTHSYWRGADIRTSTIPKNKRQEFANILNGFTYDEERPKIRTAVYGDDAHLDHIHLQSVV